MEILIKLDKRLYKYAKHHTLTSSEIDEICNVIANGIPLQKRHGRLIDADAVYKDICDSIEEMTNIGIAVDGQYLWEKLNDALFNMPTIIEADMERSKEE